MLHHIMKHYDALVPLDFVLHQQLGKNNFVEAERREQQGAVGFHAGEKSRDLVLEAGRHSHQPLGDGRRYKL